MTLTVGLLLALAALIIGYAKTAIGGLATISVAIFASVMPARESTAAILLLLIIGDVVAVSATTGATPTCPCCGASSRPCFRASRSARSSSRWSTTPCSAAPSACCCWPWWRCSS